VSTSFGAGAGDLGRRLAAVEEILAFARCCYQLLETPLVVRAVQ